MLARELVWVVLSLYHRTAAYDERDEVSTSLSSFNTMLMSDRKHLAELNYPAPRTVSKLEDQVGILTARKAHSLTWIQVFVF